MSNQNGKMLNFIAFVALVAVALLQILDVLSPIIKLGEVISNIIVTIKNLCVCLVIGITAYKFAADKSKGVKITYWVCIAIFVVFTVLIWVL